uniref:Uncharacterized protein n=1 Tax=Arundo donax TaxID=35708 RepID=A0A0A9B9A2_ARUDO
MHKSNDLRGKTSSMRGVKTHRTNSVHIFHYQK